MIHDLKRKTYPRNFREYLRLALILIILGICLQFGTSYILNLVLNALPNAASQYSEIQDELVQFNVMSVFTVCILAPLLEEAVFRILILRLGAKFIPFWIMNIIQAVLFGLYHGNWIQGIYAFLIGMILGYTMHACEWIYASVIVHMAINSSAYVIQFIPVYAEGTSALIPVIAGASILLGGAIILYLRGYHERIGKNI